MSLFTRIWNFIRRPTGYVGRDLQGNYFYEYPSRTNGRSRRVIKHRGQTDTLAVAERSRQLPVQWKAWLTHTRLHPPTFEELQADAQRQERLRQNVALIGARELEERLKLAAGAATDGSERAQEAILSPPRPDSGTARTNASAHSLSTSRPEAKMHQPQRTVKQFDHDPWVPPPASDEPQAWAPRAMRRGG